MTPAFDPQPPQPAAGASGTAQPKYDDVICQALVDMLKADHQAKLDQAKIDYQSEVNQRDAPLTTEVEIYKAMIANENALDKDVQSAYLDVAKGQIDRIQARADFVEKAAAAIITLYTGVLTVVFAAGGRALPPRGIVRHFRLEPKDTAALADPHGTILDRGGLEAASCRCYEADKTTYARMMGYVSY